MPISAALFCLLAASAGAALGQQPSRGSRANNTNVHKNMVLIRGTSFMMGTPQAKIAEIAAAFKIEKHPEIIEAESPRHQVTIGSFYLDKTEVANADFKKFVKRNPQWSRTGIAAKYHNGNYLKDWEGSDLPRGRGRNPAVNVSWYAAVAYCQSLGKRLPTEAEWEHAARGGLDDKPFPWGDAAPDPTRANYAAGKLGTTVPVGSYPPNGYGLFDMAGNVWEFVADEWGAYSSEPQLDPVAGGDLFLDDSFVNVTTRRVIRGGSWGGSPLNLRVTYRDSHPPDGARDFVGFRCAMSAGGEP